MPEQVNTSRASRLKSLPFSSGDISVARRGWTVHGDARLLARRPGNVTLQRPTRSRASLQLVGLGFGADGVGVELVDVVEEVVGDEVLGGGLGLDDALGEEP